MLKFVGMTLLVLGAAGVLIAGDPFTRPAPEIDPSSAASAITLMAGGLFVLRGARRKDDR